MQSIWLCYSEDNDCDNDLLIKGYLTKELAVEWLQEKVTEFTALGWKLDRQTDHSINFSHIAPPTYSWQNYYICELPVNEE